MMVRSKVNINNISRRLVFENTKYSSSTSVWVALLICTILFSGTTQIQKQTVQRVVQTVCSKDLMREDPVIGRIKERTENTECFVSATASWTTFSFPTKHARLQMEPVKSIDSITVDYTLRRTVSLWESCLRVISGTPPPVLQTI